MIYYRKVRRMMDRSTPDNITRAVFWGIVVVLYFMLWVWVGSLYF